MSRFMEFASRLPNGDETEHRLGWSGQAGSAWCECTACGYVPDWNMKAGPVKTPSTERDLKCSGKKL